MWTEVLATSADDLMNQVCEGKTWGGYVELAAALWHSDTEIVIAHAEEIHAQATESEVEAGIYPVMLAGLPSGTAKKRRVFVVLSGQHYHVGKVTAGGTTRVIFEIGKEADEAQSHIVHTSKASARARSRPCTLMKCGSKSERRLPKHEEQRPRCPMRPKQVRLQGQSGTPKGTPSHRRPRVAAWVYPPLSPPPSPEHRSRVTTGRAGSLPAQAGAGLGTDASFRIAQRASGLGSMDPRSLDGR